jgi:hypothetical protein
MQFKRAAVAVALAATIVASAAVVPAEMSGAVPCEFYTSGLLTDFCFCRDHAPA